MKAYSRLLNLLTVVVLGMTMMVCLCVGVTFAYPRAFFNPLKPQDDTIPALLPSVPTAAPSATPVRFPTLPPAWTASPALTSTPDVTSAATTQPSNTVEATLSGPTATHTPFPTPVGPTVTLTPTELPSRTATQRPPAPTRTSGPYPGGATDTPPAITDTPIATAYP